MDVNKICRTCLADNSTVSVFSEQISDGLKLCLSKMILMCTNLKVCINPILE